MSEDIRPMPADFYPEITRYPTGIEDSTGFAGRRCRHECMGQVIDLGYAWKDPAHLAAADECLRQEIWRCCEMIRLGRAAEIKESII